MYDYPDQDLFYVDGINKQFIIIVEADDESEDPLTLTNENLNEESFEFVDALTDSDSLSFANCTSASVKFEIYNSEEFSETFLEKLIVIYEVIDGDTENPIPIGSFTVQSDNLSLDGVTREIIAYDFMYDILNTDVTEWYNELEFPISIKDLRDSLFEEFGIEQDNESLINDDIEVPKQLSDGDYILGSDIIKAICDINGTFCHMGKDGIANWITLDTGDIFAVPLYPGFYPSENTFPGGDSYEGEVQDIFKTYYREDSVIWANYETYEIDGIQLRNELNEIAYQTSDAAMNPYTVISNFLLYGLSYGQYETIATRLLDRIKNIKYVPFEMTKMSDPCMEVGDRVIVHTQENVIFVSYLMLKRHTGILEQFESIETKGTYYLSQYDVGGYQAAIERKLKNLDQRVGNVEKSGSGPLQIQSVPKLPDNPQLNVLYLIQGEVQVT